MHKSNFFFNSDTSTQDICQYYWENGINKETVFDMASYIMSDTWSA